MIRMTSEMGYISDMNNPIEGQRQPTIKLQSMNEEVKEDKKKKKGKKKKEKIEINFDLLFVLCF